MPVSDRYSLNRRDKKLAGVCSTVGDIFNIDPTFIRIGFVAGALGREVHDAVSLDCEYRLTRALWMHDGEVDPVTRCAELGHDDQAARFQLRLHVLFERVQCRLRQRAQTEVLAAALCI